MIIEQKFLLFFAVLTISVIYLGVLQLNNSKEFIEVNLKTTNPKNNRIAHFCKTPPLDLWPNDIEQINKPPEPSICKPESYEWIEVIQGKLKFTKYALPFLRDITCEIRILFTNESKEKDPEFMKIVYIVDIIPNVKDGMDVPEDIFSVHCRYQNKTSQEYAYENLFLTIPKAHRIALSPTPFLTSKEPNWNILIWCFDSLSRLSWYRFLPKTIEAFRNAGGVWLENSNILGTETVDALLPILTGKGPFELHNSVRGEDDASYMNDFPWIWRDLQEIGYVTLLGDYGSFNWRYLGFSKPPTHHYVRPWFLAAEIFNNTKNGRYCINSKMKIEILHNYIKEFWDVYSDKPKFAVINYEEMTHDYFNDIQMADNIQEKWFEEMIQSQRLEETIVIFMSDHGGKIGSVREMVQSDWELMNPFYGILLPPKFKSLHPDEAENLINNFNKLTIPFDIHATLSDVIAFSTDGKVVLPKHATGDSLFKPLDPKRSCADVNIHPQLCFCGSSPEKIDTDDKIVKKIGQIITRKIISLLKPIRKFCSRIYLRSILKASKVQHFRIISEKNKFDRDEWEYKIRIMVGKFRGVFDGYAKFRTLSSNSKPVINLYRISRIDVYGRQPNCIIKRYPKLAPFCFCNRHKR